MGQILQDTALICLNGHIINPGINENKHLNVKFCSVCQKETISNCTNCNSKIPGIVYSKYLSLNNTLQRLNREQPKIENILGCPNCGTPYPWKGQIEALKNPKLNQDLNIFPQIESIFSNFHTVARSLRQRHNDRETLDIADEYDVQDLLRSLLHLHAKDIREEEYAPKHTEKNARMDFLLPEYKIAIEVKMTRKGLEDRKLGDELLADIGRYKEHPKAETLLCFIYDPDGRVRNKIGFIKDINGSSGDKLQVKTYIYP